MSDEEAILRDKQGNIDDYAVRGVNLVRLERIGDAAFWLQIDHRRIYLTAVSRKRLEISDMDDRE